MMEYWNKRVNWIGVTIYPKELLGPDSQETTGKRFNKWPLVRKGRNNRLIRILAYALNLDTNHKAHEDQLNQIMRAAWKALSQESEILTPVTGSLGYQSPEVAVGGKVTSLADLYSFGVVLYELLTGQHSFPGVTVEALAEKHRTSDLPSVHALRPELPAAVDEVIQKATAKDPSERYQDALEDPT